MSIPDARFKRVVTVIHHVHSPHEQPPLIVATIRLEDDRQLQLIRGCRGRNYRLSQDPDMEASTLYCDPTNPGYLILLGSSEATQDL